jgi:HK97 family phage portal protein
VRSPVGALLAVRNAAPVPYVGRGYAGRMHWGMRNNAEAQLSAMGSVGTLFAIVDRLANDTSRVKWKLYRSAASGKDEDRTEVTSHAALDIWRRPNQFFTGQEFRETTQQHLDLVGEGWWVIARNPRMRSIPLELWPVRPDRMMPVPSAERFLAGYIYLGPDGEQVPLQTDEVIQLRRPNPLDPYRGMGPVQSVLADIDSSRYSAEWNRNFFINGAGPGGVIQVDKRLDDTEFNEMVARWREQHQGVANAHRVAIVEQGTWQDVTYSMRDMQFADLRNVQREIIREAFAFPKSELGTADQVNLANAKVGAVTLARGHIVPRLERMKAALNEEFLPLFGATGKGVEFDYENPVPEDQETENAQLTARTNAFKVLIDAGVDEADAAEVCDLPRMTIKAVKPPPAALPPGQEPPPVPGGQPPPVPAAPPAARLRVVDVDQPTGDLPDLQPVQDAWTAALADLLTQWANVLAAWTDHLVGAVRTFITGGDRGGLATVQLPDEVLHRGDGMLSAAMIRLAVEAAHQAVREAAQYGVDLQPGDVAEDELREVASGVVNMLGREMSVSAGREAFRVWTPGADGEEEARRVADAVRQHLEDLSDARPRQWLGNALTQAQHAGRTATMQRAESGRAAPSVAYYGHEQLDSNTCRYCREIDGRWLGNSITDALRDYPAGGYVRCEGGPRCRGFVAAVYRPKTTGDAA